MATKAPIAVQLIEQNLQALPHPEVGMLRLTQFSQPSPGVMKIKHQIAEGLILLLENNGFHVLNGLSEAKQLLEDNGYAVVESVEWPEGVDFEGSQEADGGAETHGSGHADPALPEEGPDRDDHQGKDKWVDSYPVFSG